MLKRFVAIVFVSFLLMPLIVAHADVISDPENVLSGDGDSGSTLLIVIVALVAVLAIGTAILIKVLHKPKPKVSVNSDETDE